MSYPLPISFPCVKCFFPVKIFIVDPKNSAVSQSDKQKEKRVLCSFSYFSSFPLQFLSCFSIFSFFLTSLFPVSQQKFPGEKRPRQGGTLSQCPPPRYAFAFSYHHFISLCFVFLILLRSKSRVRTWLLRRNALFEEYYETEQGVEKEWVDHQRQGKTVREKYMQIMTNLEEEKKPITATRKWKQSVCSVVLFVFWGYFCLFCCFCFLFISKLKVKQVCDSRPEGWQTFQHRLKFGSNVDFLTKITSVTMVIKISSKTKLFSHAWNCYWCASCFVHGNNRLTSRVNFAVSRGTMKSLWCI